jgi:hypothetical protein
MGARCDVAQQGLREDAFVARLLAFDPEARNWLKGCSWRFALAEGATYPALVKPDRPLR